MNETRPFCYVCRNTSGVKLLGTASLPAPPKNPDEKVEYLEAGLVSLGVTPLTEDRFASNLYFCQGCNLIWRSANLLDGELSSRLDKMVTVLPVHEETWLKRRAGYFQNEFLKLKQLVEKTAQPPVSYLDIGCSYGHLLDIAHKNGWKVAGVDASETLVEHLRPRKGYPLYHVLLPKDPLPFPDGSLDLITFYDSFYMLEDPLVVLNHVYDKLKPGGYLLLRLTNRNLYARLWLVQQKLLRNFQGQHEIDAIGILGDQKYSYSLKSFTKLVRMSKFGGAKVSVRLLERGKKGTPLVTRFVYLGGQVLSWAFLKQVVLTPSFTAFVQKQRQ